MNFTYLVFLFFGAVLVLSGLLVVTVRNPVHAALWLVLSFFTAAALWLLLYAEFLAITLVLVYVGAVMVLFLFVVMMLDINIDLMREGFWRNLPLGLTVGGLMAVEMVLLVLRGASGESGGPGAPPPGYSNTKALGHVLYTDYLFPFEIAAVILLVAIVAAIALTLRERKDKRTQDPAEQVKVRRADRARLVSMPVEKDQ